MGQEACCPVLGSFIDAPSIGMESTSAAQAPADASGGTSQATGFLDQIVFGDTASETAHHFQERSQARSSGSSMSLPEYRTRGNRRKGRAEI